MNNLVRKSPSMLRQTWLETCLAALRKHFAKHGFEVPDSTRVSIGFGYGRAEKIAGQCWAPESSSDKHCEIFISPSSRDAKDIIGTLAHELCHAVDGNKNGHKGAFKRIALAIGLTGKMSSTVNGELMQAFAKEFIKKNGSYPAGSLSKLKGPGKKQTTRLLKCECPHCGYTVRTTKKWLDELGPPRCAIAKHGKMETDYEGGENDE